jgi:acetylornithine deacetylase/succinyl-diaminopimelate desuccinylase-like protein
LETLPYILFPLTYLLLKRRVTIMTWATYLQEHQPQHQNELLEFLRIPSISSLPEHAPAVQQAAHWVSNRLITAGLEKVEVLPTGGHPVVYGEWLHAQGKSTVLIYGHFDTQPAGSIDLWNSPPFEPVIIDDRVYARGATDDKGSLLTPILAVEALLNEDGTLPVNVKFLFEGEEEIGSPHLTQFIADHRDLLACDLILSADGIQYSEDQPELIVAFKGVVGIQIDVRGPNADIHSGLFGGAVANPIHGLAHILDSLRGPDGKILVEGFYDDVLPLSAEDRLAIAHIPFNAQTYKDTLGINTLIAEAGYTPQEHIAGRPTVEVSGIWGGIQGDGVNAIVPGTAHAKIICRLVANQDPATISKLLTAHIEKHTQPGLQVSIHPLTGFVKPYLIPVDHWGNQIAADVLTELYGKAPYYVRVGGGLPITSLFLDQLDAYTVSFAFALDDEQLHSPNEFFRLSSFRRGAVAYCKVLQRLSAR